jgi:hypothetical protein
MLAGHLPTHNTRWGWRRWSASVRRHLSMAWVWKRTTWLLEMLTMAHVVLPLMLLLMLLLLRLLLLLLLGRPLLSHVLLHVGCTLLEVLTLRHVVLLLDFVVVLSSKAIASTHSAALHLQRLLKSSWFSLEDDIHAHQLTFATVDRTPLVLHARDAILNGPVILPKLSVLIFNELVDDPPTVRGGDLSHFFLDVPVVSSEFV